ncbi:hypothetical protein L3Q82_003476 [Scortum barcoo]|uniref:Uncharacterized protein n=1 Tax=Scortum barcoo TaxID=214431 RepID=A0ACB8VMV9_9TELE|nr:hypothetical protein L3Q82_003476 [Scortum barcoo]
MDRGWFIGHERIPPAKPQERTSSSYSGAPRPCMTVNLTEMLRADRPNVSKKPVPIRPPSPRASLPRGKELQRSLSCEPPPKPIIRQRSHSLPSATEKKKQQCRSVGVRFVDSLGLDLEDVRVFRSGEDPFVPHHVTFRLLMSAELADRRLLEISLPYLRPLFAQQPGDQPGFLHRLHEQRVCLERVLCFELGVIGITQVLNLDFEKEVTARYSFTDWKSCSEAKASWVSTITKTCDGGGELSCDTFRFHLPVPPFLQPGAVLQFAIQYKVCGAEYWDNNGGENYKLVCHNYKLTVPKECEDSMWFEKCRQLWIQCGPKWDETLFSLSEDFFDALMVVHDACKEGTYKVTEIFLYPVGQLVVDPRIYILIQKEAIRKFNLILDKIPMELKKKRKILTSQEASDIMIKLAGQILEGGDYDVQTALTEALCRMASPDQRRELADQWFSMEHVASAFVKICDSEFETDCRKFLNMVNGMQGDGRRVYSYPCLEVYLDQYELLMPADEKLEEFWIDFNLGSHSISFYFSLPDDEAQEGQWETICINENEVQSYTVTEEGKRLVLQLKLTEVVVVGTAEGSSLTIHFSSSLDIMQAVRRVYGHNKNKGFVGKTGTSVVKTTVKILMEENSSQVVPESQLSLGESEKNTAPYLLPVPSAAVQSNSSVQSTVSKQASKMKLGKNKKNIPLAKAVDMVLAGQGEESLESRSSLAQQQEHQSSAQRLSAPVHGPISQKQLHTELTQRLQQVLREANRDAAPQAAAQRKMSYTREDSKGRSSEDRFASTLCTPKGQQAQRNGLANGKIKGQMSPEADAALITAPAKAKPLQERIPNVKVGTKRALTSKEKRDAEVAGSMVKLISSRYQTNTQSKTKDTAGNNLQSCSPPFVNRPIFNMNWLSTGKRKDKIFTDTSAISSSGFTDSSVAVSTTKKGQPAAKEKRYLKKHLFSDTDTDCAMTEVSWLRESSRKPKPNVTKYSRQAPIKPKVASPHTSYQSPDLPPHSEKPVKCNTKPNKYSSTNHLDNAEKTQEAAQVMKKKTASKQRSKSNMKLESNSLPELESMSEMPPTPKKYFIGQQGENEKTCSEVPQVKKRKNTPFEQCTDTYRRLDSINQMSDVKKTSGLKQQRPVNVPPETSKLDKKNVVLAQEQMNALKDFRAACQTSVGPSPPFIERMRSAERSAPTLCLTRSPLITPRGSPLPASPIPLNQNTPSPIPLLPRPHSAVSSIGNYRPSSFYSAEKKHSSSKTQSIQSVPSFPSLTPIRLTPAPDVEAVLTSTHLELDKPSMPSAPQSPFPEDTVNHSCHYSLSKVSSVSLSQSSIKSSVLIGRVKDSPTAALAVFHQAEKTPLSDRDLKPAKLLISGPSRKRHISSSSNSEEDEKEERKKSKKRCQRSPRMKPRKLFKSCTKVSAEAELSQVMSSSHMLSSSHWETEVGDGDMDEEDLELPKMAGNLSDLYQKFSSDLKKKFQNRCNMMEVYNKQSLRTVQQHVSSLNVQVTKYRTQRLKQVEAALLEEIHRLEQSETVLKNMEKDLTMNWKKQTIAFHSYQEQEIRRNETLKEVLQSNTCHSLEYEERIFTSQV